MSIIPRLVIDSTAAPTELCMIGHETGTDKTPYNLHGHRHPYTAVYSLLFARYKHQPVRFAEIGVAMGASTELWSKYFRHPSAKLAAFDCDEKLLQQVQARVSDTRLELGQMDVSVDNSVREALKQVGRGEKYDIIIDDSSHNHEHQIRIIKESFPLLNSGGMLIIEDIFRATAEEDYEKHILEELGACAEAFFIDCEHRNKWSPGWDNDKLLILIKG